MSSDHTDSESAPKKLTRAVLPWRNPAIRSLWSKVDDRWSAIAKLHRRGNRPLERSIAAQPVDSLRRPPKGLPINFYCAKWLKSLSDVERHDLHWKMAIELPTVVGVFNGISRSLLTLLY